MLVMRFFSSPRIKQLVTVGSVVVTVAFILGLQMMGRTTPDPRVALELMNDHLDGQSGLWPHVWMAKSLLIFLDRYPYSFLESLFPLLLLSFVLTFVLLLFWPGRLAGWAPAGIRPGTENPPVNRGSVTRRLRGPILEFYARIYWYLAYPDDVVRPSGSIGNNRFFPLPACPRVPVVRRQM